MGPSEPPPASSPAQHLGRFLRALKKFWWIPVLTLAAGVGVGVFCVSRMSPVYVSWATMWEPSKVRLPDQSAYAEEGESAFGTQIQLLQSGKLQELAMEHLAAGSSNGTAEVESYPVVIHASVVPKSSLLAIQASSPNPAFTRNYLDALMQALLDYNKDVRNRMSGITLSSLSDQLQGRELELKTEEDALMDFQQSNNLAIIQEEASVAGSYLANLQTQLSQLQLQAQLLGTAIRENQEAAAGGTNVPIPLDLSTGPGGSAEKSGPEAASATDLQLMKMERAELAKYLSADSRQLVELDQQIKRAENSQQISLRMTTDQLMADLKANQIKTQYITNSVNEWEAKVVAANTRLNEAEHLKVNIQHTQAVIDRLTTLSQNLSISRSVDQEALAVLEPASDARRSYQLEKARFGLCSIAGLLAGLGLVLLIGIRDDRLISVGEVNSFLGDAVVGLLPKVEETGGAALLAPNDPRHVYIESYRNLGSALRFLVHGSDQPKILLITSAAPNEGKSTVSTNLAHTLAASGSRVLLVDGDLRKGQLHRLLGLNNNKGLMDLLAGNCEEADVLQHNSLPNLAFISRGNTAGQPGDLLFSPRVDEILDRWRKEFDYVLIDSSPVFAAADTICLAPRVDGTLFLVRSHHSSARMTREALELLVQRRSKVVGVVFNMAEASSGSHYYYKYTDYHPPVTPAQG